MSAPGHSKNKRPKILRLWLSAIDPGLIRLQSAGRAALAVLSIWLVLRTGWKLLFGEGGPPIPLFGVLSGLVFLLFIIDLKPSDAQGQPGVSANSFCGSGDPCQPALRKFLAEQSDIAAAVLLFVFFPALWRPGWGAGFGGGGGLLSRLSAPSPPGGILLHF